VLFAGLALVKGALLWEFRSELSQAHWRIGGFEPTLLDQLAFCAFALILVTAILSLGRSCQSRGIGTVRVANGLVLCFAALFILLSFHEGDRNLLYPIQTGILSWSDLGPYLSLNLFFRPPYLAAWIGAYVLVYWLAARSGREIHAHKLTAAFAGAYVLLCLRDLPLEQARNTDLPIVVAVGAACLLGARWSRKPLTILWYAVALGWGGIFWFIVTCSASAAGPGLDHFAAVAAVLLSALLAAELISRKAGFHATWSHLAPFTLTLFVLLGMNHYPTAANHHAALAVAFSAGRYFVGEFVLAFLVMVAAWLWRRIRPHGSLLFFDFVSVLLVLTAIIDLRLAQVMGIRLSWDVLEFADSPVMVWRMAKAYLPSLAVALSVVTVVYALSVTSLGRRGRSLSVGWPSLSRQNSVCLLVVMASLLTVVGFLRVNPDKGLGESVLRVAATSTYFRNLTAPPLSADEFLMESEQLGLPIPAAGHERGSAPRTSDPLNVVFILLESTYDKHLSLFGSSEHTQPLLTQYRDRMELFPNFFCNYMGSIHARFACFTGLNPVRDYNQFTLQRVPVKSIFEVFNDQDYHCSLFYSSFFDYTGFGDFLRGRGLSEMYDAKTMPPLEGAERVSWGVQETETLAAIKSRIRKHAHDADRFFLTYIPASPHYPYDGIPATFRKHKLKQIDDMTPAYLNSLLYMDWVVSEIIREVEAVGLLDHTLIVITGDHGEMLGEDDGKMGHGWVVTPELANVPLIIMDPNRPGGHINYTVGSQVDLLPTVADLAGVRLRSDELYQGRSLHRGNSENRLIYINSYGQFGVVQQDVIGIGDRVRQSSGFGDLERFRVLNALHSSHFEATAGEQGQSADIARFDRFQESFLQNYGTMRNALRDRLEIKDSTAALSQ